MREITYADAVREAMSEEMRRDKEVFFMGEDIGVYNGAFGVSKGMIQEFGEERVIETPISETGFVGAGVGAALMGMRPIVELMFSDFMAVCYDQIINQSAKIRFMLGGAVSVPMVIRTASGGGTGAAAQHSQSLENLYCHVPGLKVVVPSTAYDAKGLLKSAIRDNNTVIFLEQKKLYRVKGEVPEEEYTIPLGKADLKRSGKDVSVITYGRMVQMSLELADKLAWEGIDVEVLDLRTLVPLDKSAVINTAKKTRRVVIVHEAVEFSGFGAELAAIIADSEAFWQLEAPIKRVGAIYSPIPFNPVLEESVFPTPERIEAAIREAMQGSGSAPAGTDAVTVDEGSPFRSNSTVRADYSAPKIRMTPLAGYMARAGGFDVSNIKGSGYLGKIFAGDLTGAVPAAAGAATVASAAIRPEEIRRLDERDTIEIVNMNAMRKVIAHRMAVSAQEIPSVTQNLEADVTALLALRNQINEGRSKETKVTMNTFMIKAAAISAMKHARFRMQLTGNHAFVLHSSANVGFAVGMPDGLLVPVIKHANEKTVYQIAEETGILIQKARTNTLKPEDYGCGVITVSNMGMYGTHSFSPIINQPEASILGINAPAERLVQTSEGILPRSYLMLSLTFDHRIINGTEAAEFELTMKELLEKPEQLL